MFKFDDEVRLHIMALGELMCYANSRNDGRWAWQSSDPAYDGVYGAAYTAAKRITAEEVGSDVAEEAFNRINYGGDKSFGLDIENAVEEAIEILASGEATEAQ